MPPSASLTAPPRVSWDDSALSLRFGFDFGFECGICGVELVQIYIAGGYGAPDSSGILATVTAYDIATDTYDTSLPDMPGGGRYLGAGVTVAGTLYVLGGRIADSAAVDTVEVPQSVALPSLPIPHRRRRRQRRRRRRRSSRARREKSFRATPRRFSHARRSHLRTTAPTSSERTRHGPSLLFLLFFSVERLSQPRPT